MAATEVGDCDYLGSYDAQVTDLTVVIGKGKDAASTYSGTVDLYLYTEDEGPVEPAGSGRAVRGDPDSHRGHDAVDLHQHLPRPRGRRLLPVP